MKKQTIIVAVLIASFALWGVFEALADNRLTKLGGALPFMHLVFISGLILWWATLDSVNRGRSLSAAWKIALIFLGIVSMPFYLHTTRQRDRRWISIAKGLVVFATSCAIYYATYTLVGVCDA